ncbi:MAG: putative two-component-system connector protein YcgZ [Candidatus Erwinia impunctatus]|nr:putative two-component-system connector protein YcgZ [Culicoides impunctatus]
MRHDTLKPQTEQDIAHYFLMSAGGIPSQQDTLGQIVIEILSSGHCVNRKAICSKLLTRLELSENAAMEKHYYQLIGMLFGRESV